MPVAGVSSTLHPSSMSTPLATSQSLMTNRATTRNKQQSSLGDQSSSLRRTAAESEGRRVEVERSRAGVPWHDPESEPRSSLSELKFAILQSKPYRIMRSKDIDPKVRREFIQFRPATEDRLEVARGGERKDKAAYWRALIPNDRAAKSLEIRPWQRSQLTVSLGDRRPDA